MNAYYNTDGKVILAHDTVTLDLPFIFINECKFLKPKMNLETLELYESATQEEIDAKNKPKVPVKVKKASFKLALIKNGISTSTITDTIYKMPSSLEKDEIITLWEDTEEFYRNNKQLNSMSSLFNISQEQLDGIFILADKL